LIHVYYTSLFKDTLGKAVFTSPKAVSTTLVLLLFCNSSQNLFHNLQKLHSAILPYRIQGKMSNPFSHPQYTLLQFIKIREYSYTPPVTQKDPI